MMIRAPGVTVPGPRDGLAATVDLYPTLVELCGLEDRATRHPSTEWTSDLSCATPGRPSAR